MPLFTHKSNNEKKESKGQEGKDDEASKTNTNLGDTAQDKSTICQDKIQQPLAAGGKADDERDESDLDPNKRVGAMPLMQKTSSIDDKTVSQQEGDQSTSQQEGRSERVEISLTGEKKLNNTQPLTNRNIQAQETNAEVTDPDAQTGDQGTQRNETQPQARSLDAKKCDPDVRSVDVHARNLDTGASDPHAHTLVSNPYAQASDPDDHDTDPVGHATDPVGSATDQDDPAVDANARSGSTDTGSRNRTQDSFGPDREFAVKKEIAQASCRQNGFSDEDINKADQAYFKEYGNRRYSGEDLAKIIMNGPDRQMAGGGTASVNDKGHPADDGTPHTCEVNVHIRRCRSCTNCKQQQQISYNVKYE